ncbi:ATP-binding cassette domain-containing protein [Bacillus pseudomycoides]|uniref:ATP-binding cassette domain-containing protein n=1 Tax=Bacillus TaxID=1386 RepID=UPI000BED910B|nr:MULTISPECIES: ATP-binding cassette domain-containing protein [Bacillus]MCX2829679.1 ATP-binding cassette domain-containing protein [Bacillus sp. DHT2]MDR4918866.1 ATP-binding cassette domain-containing protein [Bacillus pseudomycoides]PEB38582.1 multidrug ABC transporter ATP-binding protein [Bacillus pseudomycoides]
MKYVIEVKEFTKVIKNHTVLKNINLGLEKGKIYGFQGKNGSGKTMLLRAICGLIKPNKGEVFVNQKKLDNNFPDSIGLLIEYPGFLPSYTGFQNLKLLASIQNKINDEHIKGVLTQVGLEPTDKRKVRKYSLGMKQRLGIAQAVMENPDILVLDEPTNALDKNAVKIVRELLLHLKQQGKTIIIASHDQHELQLLCDDLYTIDNGEIIEHQTTKLSAL